MKPDSAARRFLESLAVEDGASPRTLDAYRRDLVRYATALREQGDPELEDVRAEQVTRFLEAEHRAGMGPTTLARRLAAVRGLHRWAQGMGIARDDPARDAKGPKRPARLPKAISVAEVEALLAAVAGDDPVALRDRALLELGYATGLRASEIVAVDIAHLEEEPGMLRVRGKGSVERWVPVGAIAMDAVHAWIARGRAAMAGVRAADALFVNRRGRRLTRIGFWEIVRERARAAHLDGRVSPHTLRHSFATHLLEGGADLRVVQELLGHADLSTTQVYTRVDATYLREVHKSFHPRERAGATRGGERA